MGTTYSLKIVEHHSKIIDSHGLQKEVDSLLFQINIQLSTYIDSSVISEFNRNYSLEPIAVSPEVYEVAEKAVNMYQLSGGSFDATVKPLVDLWGFGPQFKTSQIPDSSKIKETILKVGSEKLIVKNGNLQKTNRQLQIDLSAIAKGWGVDKLAEYLLQKGFNNFMVEIGGEIVVSGLNKDNQPWKIGILHPDGLHLELYSKIEVSNKAVATSGIYQNYFTWEGNVYSHLINPITGYPIQHDLVSATIVAQDCATADAIATAVMVKGFDEGLRWINNLPNVECLLVKKSDTGEYFTGKSSGFNY